MHVGQGSADLGLARLHEFASGCNYWAALLLLAGLSQLGCLCSTCFSFPWADRLAKGGSSHSDTGGVRELGSNMAHLILLIKIGHKAKPKIRQGLKFNMPIGGGRLQSSLAKSI